MSIGRLINAVFLVATLWLAMAGREATAVRFTDPAGDTFYSRTSDLVSIDVITGPESFRFQLEFADTIKNMLSRAPDGLLAFIDIDIDQDATTGSHQLFGSPVPGGNSLINFLIQDLPPDPSIPGPLVGIGSEFIVALNVTQSGSVNAFLQATDFSSNPEIVAFAVENSIFLEVPFDDLGDHDGAVNFAAVAGDVGFPTDRMTNGALPMSSLALTEPASSALILMGCLSAVGVARWSRPRLERARSKRS